MEFGLLIAPSVQHQVFYRGEDRPGALHSAIRCSSASLSTGGARRRLVVGGSDFLFARSALFLVLLPLVAARSCHEAVTRTMGNFKISPDPNAAHLCLDMQRLFSFEGPWPTPWMERVLPKSSSSWSGHRAGRYSRAFSRRKRQWTCPANGGVLCEVVERNPRATG